MRRKWLPNAVLSCLQSDNGASSIEYSLIASLIAMAIIGGVVIVSQRLNDNFYNKIGSAFT